MVLSTHKVEVVPVRLERHPNADTLSLVRVFDGYPCIVRTEEWADGDLAAYVPPDSVVDVTRPEFAWLAKGEKTKHRVRTIKLRGVQSMGLLLKAPPGANVGDDVADHFGVEHYEPEMKSACTGGEAEAAPPQLARLSRYDVDSLRRYRHCFRDGELVQVTEKIHGANSRFACVDDRMWCGSRSEWKRESLDNLWWRVMRDTPEIENFCRDFPDYVLFGEVYGWVQSLHYGLPKNAVRFAAFDVLTPQGEYLPADHYRSRLADYGVPLVPVLDWIQFDFDRVCQLAEGPSTVFGANHIREGCVAKPSSERWHQSCGRVILKVVGTGYLEKGE